MGYRNPVTTASAVDTRAGAGAAGARLYSQPIPGQAGAAQGVLELDDGLGDTPATLTATPGTQHSVTGGVVTLDGGSFSSTPNTKVDLQVVPAGSPELHGVSVPGQFGRVARVRGADVLQVDAGTKILADGVPIVVGSKAQRDALDNTVPGTTVVRTDFGGGINQRWDGSAWRYLTYGVASGITDVNALLTVPHGGSGEAAPAAWVAFMSGQQTDPITQVLKLVGWGADATNLTVRAVRTDTSAYFPGTPIRFFWVAYF